MTEVFVIRNQLGHYWGKSKAWVDGSEARTVMRVKHEDEAINTLFELSSKDVELRGEVVRAELSARGDPMVEPSEIPLLVEEVEPEQVSVPADAAVQTDAAAEAEVKKDPAPTGDPQVH